MSDPEARKGLESLSPTLPLEFQACLPPRTPAQDQTQDRGDLQGRSEPPWPFWESKNGQCARPHVCMDPRLGAPEPRVPEQAPPQAGKKPSQGRCPHLPGGQALPCGFLPPCLLSKRLPSCPRKQETCGAQIPASQGPDLLKLQFH